MGPNFCKKIDINFLQNSNGFTTISEKADSITKKKLKQNFQDFLDNGNNVTGDVHHLFQVRNLILYCTESVIIAQSFHVRVLL